MLLIFKNLEEVKFIIHIIACEFISESMDNDGLDCIFMSYENVM